MPRSKQASTSHTNIWLRRTFDLRSVPGENIEFRVSCDHDAQVFVNGVLAATADWTDAAVLTPCSQAGRAAFKQGANVLAVYCQDADGGAPIAVDIFSSKEPAPGRKELLEEFNQRIAAEPRRAALYFARAGLHARQSHWQEAAEDLSKASELSPSDPVTLRALGLVLLETGEVARYEHLRTDALPRLAKGVAPSPSQVLFLLASPASGNELETAATVADLLAGTHPEATLGWRQFAKGLAEFRLGHWSKSIDWTGQARSSAARESLPLWNHERESTLTAASWAVEAMAKWRSGQPIPARVALDKAAQIVEQQLPAPDYGDLGRDWPAWLTARLFLKEAQTMISERH
jgi:tetratricopeptide (TPR) repeat protein